MKTSFSILALSLLALIAGNIAGNAEIRTFTNKDGKPLKAEVVSKTDSHVKLKTPTAKGGKIYTIVITTLSEKDQEFVKNWKNEGADTKDLANVDLEAVMKAKGYTKVEFDEEMNHLLSMFRSRAKKAGFCSIRVPWRPL
jgi:hypothetical protein